MDDGHGALPSVSVALTNTHDAVSAHQPQPACLRLMQPRQPATLVQKYSLSKLCHTSVVEVWAEVGKAALSHMLTGGFARPLVPAFTDCRPMVGGLASQSAVAFSKRSTCSTI